MQKILVQLDSDAQPSVFDAVVAIDSQVDRLLQYSKITAENVEGLVHGGMFTRGPADLKNTAFFIGGSNVTVGEAILKRICKTFFGPVRCSVMFDGNGSNTTAVAAVLSAMKHVSLGGTKCVVLGGTGPVGRRVARLLYGLGSHVALTSRDSAKANQAADEVRAQTKNASSSTLVGLAADDSSTFTDALNAAEVLISCGAAGAQLITSAQLSNATKLKVAIDLNAVPPAGIAGIGVMDKAVARDGRFDYGAIGVGGLKMKIHRAAIQSLFERNDAVLDAEEIFAIGSELLSRA